MSFFKLLRVVPMSAAALWAAGFPLPLDVSVLGDVNPHVAWLIQQLTSIPVVTAVTVVVAVDYLWSFRTPAELPYDIREVKGLAIAGKKANPAISDIPQLVKDMRECFNAGVSRPIAKRLEQLKAMRQFFVDNEAAIVEALHKDLGRPKAMALYYDVLLPIHEIDDAIKNIHKWTAPKPVGFNLIAFPSSQWLQEEPLGVALVISTWNFPILLGLTPAVGAIAAGNTVVLKPCVVSSATAKLVMDVLPKYMDPQILSVVGGHLSGDRECTAALLKEKFDSIFFTGSPTVGRVIMRGAAEHLTPVTLELGGKNPVFVDSDVDIKLAAKRTVWGRMLNCGQQCIAPDYVLCNSDVVDEFCAEAKKWIPELYGADPKNNGNFGRIVGERQMKRLVGLLNNPGGTIIAGGKYDEEARFIEPTIIRTDDFNAPVMEGELFGPILVVVPVATAREAIHFVNSRPKPLSLYIFSNNVAFQEKVVANTSSGGVTINGCLFHVAHTGLPFGGVGDSGVGAYHGKYSFDVFSHSKPVLQKATWYDFGLLSDPFFVYPPWTNLKEKIVRNIMKL